MGLQYFQHLGEIDSEPLHRFDSRYAVPRPSPPLIHSVLELLVSLLPNFSKNPPLLKSAHALDVHVMGLLELLVVPVRLSIRILQR